MLTNFNFAKLGSLAKSGLIHDSTISKGVIKRLKDLNLYDDKAFFDSGEYLVTDRDLINLNIVVLENETYLLDYEVILKTTDQKYDGSDAKDFSTLLGAYRRYNNNKKLDFAINEIHEMGFFTQLPDINASISYEKDQAIFEINDTEVTCENNPIIRNGIHNLFELLKVKLPKYFSIKGHSLYLNHYSPEVRDYFINALENREGYSYLYDSIELTSEIIYVDDLKVLEKIIIDYLINRLSTEIITKNEIINIINRFASLESCRELADNIDEENIYNFVMVNIDNNKLAKKNFFFAKDIIESNTFFIGQKSNLLNKTGELSQILSSQFNIGSTTKSVTIVSKYLTAFNLEKESHLLNSGEKKKIRVIEVLIELSRIYGFDFKIITNSRKKHHFVTFVYNTLEDVHGRYLFVENDTILRYKLDAELDHFDFLEDSKVCYKDLAIIYIEEDRFLPAPLRSKAGENNVYNR